MSGKDPLVATLTKPSTAGRRSSARPATTYSRHSSIVRASAPTTGTPPSGGGTTSQSSLNQEGTDPMTKKARAT